MRDRASTEDLITPCVTLLESLALHHVRDDWVNTIWDGQFTESQVRSASLNDYWWTFYTKFKIIFSFFLLIHVNINSLYVAVVVCYNIKHLSVNPIHIHRMINQSNSDLYVGVATRLWGDHPRSWCWTSVHQADIVDISVDQNSWREDWGRVWIRNWGCRHGRHQPVSGSVQVSTFDN